ncbi:aminotransferase class I/II-fold pyridoxal phosphate-dependent enzyme [Petrocella sp. FN5]|uniref:aminotransferase class I/II-fold pyridoxal phosphate-dependent enzyme n=1 Tax=Petrocella sp. FN5 TaxID=3032002 RepID=UPI0023DA1D9A|nr:aminotransferase class I/II-fold pyridoxal phosphate-dependent enzyme [Petrocella sp. FN5]MDF1616643.1 aminotransferase class I/II-fold pyridoxal phosphate-dependent enzyme [Petrocella sp. FN5]
MLKHGGYTKDILDFSVNVNPCITQALLMPYIKRAVGEIGRYPDIQGNALVEKIAEIESISVEHIIVGNGASDCLYTCARALKPQSVLIIEPTFTEYRRAFEVAGSHVLSLSINLLDQQEKTEEILIQQIRKIKADMVIVCNPNNPTGALYKEAFIEQIIKIQAAHKGFVLLDASFRQFEGLSTYFDEKRWNLIVLMSLTKYYGVPGLRCGYLMATKSVIMAMKAEQVPWSVNGLVLDIMPKLMEDKKLIEATQEWYPVEKNKLEKALIHLSFLEPMKSRTNFICCKLSKGSGHVLNQWLLNQVSPMAIRTCEDFVGMGDEFIRIGLKDALSNDRLIEALKCYEEEVYG